MMLFRSSTPDSTVWKRFRSGQDGFTFTRTGDIYEAKVVANAERVVDLFYTLSELMAPAVDVYIYDARSQTSWSGQTLALPDVRDAVARLKVPLSTYGGVEVTLFTPEDQLTLTPQIELFIYSRSDRWMYLLNSMNLEERASLEERLWGVQSWERAPAPALSDAVAAAGQAFGQRADLDRGASHFEKWEIRGRDLQNIHELETFIRSAIGSEYPWTAGSGEASWRREGSVGGQRIYCKRVLRIS